MSLRSQRRKAMVLSVLMVMLAQSAYSQYYQGWYPPVLEEEPEKKFVNPVVCASETRASGTAINVNQVLGNDSYAGTSDCPMKSLSAAVNEAVNDDEIIIHSGLYHDNVSIDGIDNLVIRAATGATVIFDGTKSITDDLGGVWSIADANGIQEVTLSQDGWQLFLAHEEQVPARWPNAQFSDETVFNRSYMAEGTLTNSNNAYTIGWLTDAGPETGVHTGLNETINATGLDPVGAIAVMNLGSFRSNSREITGWNSANGTFSYDGTGVGWKAKHHAYFLEGKRELIDTEGEWWYNNSDNRLHYKTPSSQDANDLDLRVKVQPFAISVDNSDGVTIQGIDFFGTTVNFNNCDGCSFTNSTLQYPSTSKRGLGIAGESEDDRWMTRFYRCKNTFVDKISITNTDGGALEFHGSGGQSHNNTVNNSYFHAIDWSAADQKGLMTTIYEGGRDMYFTNNSVHLTGASSVLSIGDAPKVFYNRVWDVGHLQTDGAVVQVMQGEAPGAEIAYNWIHDVIKYGARFDAPIGQAGEGRNGTMHHNVIWNAAGGLMVKGDYHNIHNNTIFNSTGKNDIIFLTDGGINNKNSTLHYNAVDAMADHRSDDVFANPLPNGSHWNNWNGYLQGYDGMFEARNQISCAIYDNGSLYCWGRNDHGQLGLGSTSGREDAPQYVDFGAGRTVTSLGIGSSGAEGWEPNSHTCVVLDNGSLMCWGANGDGQLGIGNVSSNGVWEPSFVNVGSGVTVISVATASSSTCALLSNQSVKCWGRNNFGQLGLGNISNNDVLTPQFVNFIGSSKPVSLHSGMNSYCAKLDNGSIACWGRNIDGELGLGNTTNQNKPVTLSTPAGRTVSTVSLGKRFMCLSYDNGSVACVGINNENQLGQGGGGASQSSLLYVKGIEMIAHRVDAAQEVACAHLVNGSVVCWGKDDWGLFGNSSSSYTSRTASTATEYVNFGATRTAASISVSMRHSCAILDNGDLACWGRNHKSQLGFGNITQQFMPVVVTNVSSIRQIQIHELLVDPANEDFRPKWGSHLQQLSAGAYDAGDINPWTAGISWTYSTPPAPVAGCMLDYADNYDSDAIISDGSCTFSSYTPPSSLDLRLHVDPANNGSYSGSGTDLVDMSTYGNDGTIDGATWEANRTRFYYDGSCSGSTAPANQPGTYVCDEVTFAETNDHDPDVNGDWSVSVWMNATTVQHSVIIGKWNGGGSASDLGYIIRIGSDNKLYTSVGTTSGSSAVSTSRISIDEDRWYHLVMVADAGNILRLYADGVNVVNASLSGSGSIRNTTSGISIGSYNAGEYNQPFDGNIGEVMIFADALNSTTINQMYNASKGAYSNTTSLSYSDSSYTFVKGQPYNLPLTISNGDVTTSYTLTGSLPNGMSFGSDNGTIWGTPTADMTSTTYTITANNSAGSFSTSFQMQVMSAPSGLTYSPSSMTLEKGTMMTTNTPTYSGSAPSSWAINATLPSGLSFDTSSGAISGTPTVTQTTGKTYTITATNSHGSASTSVSITINDQVPVISYTSPVEISNNREMTTATPTNTGGAVTSWVITPSLPTGLSFGTTNGSIWGTPENVTSNAIYTVYANNSGGSGTTTVALNMVWTLTPSVEGAFITRNNSIGSDITWEWDYNSTTAVSGAACGILPALPTGLSLTTGTCAITGTPTSTAINTTYTIWANISGESFSGQVWLEVGLNAPIPSYSPNTYTFTKNTTISTINSVNTGGEVTTWDLETSLPSGLNLGATNGSIWGTPDALSSTATYTIWANNSAGSASTTITLTVNDIPPSISYSVPYLKLLKGSAMTALTVTNSGGAIISCSVSPSLPNGMSLSSTCELSGTPTVSTTNTSYTVTATNTGGSDSTSIYIEVLNSGGTLTVTPTHSTGSVNATLASIAASYSHSLTIPSWTSGVTNTSGMLNNSASVAGTAIAAWDNGALAVAWTRPIYGGTTQHVLALSVYDGSSWTTQDLDTASRTGYRPSIAIDNQGALHIAYIDRDNTNLRYATNASGTWVLTTIDNSSANPVNDWVRTGIAIDNQGHVHIIHPVDGSSSIKLLNYTTNVSGSFVSTTISDTTNDDGKYASIAIAGNGSLHISVYRDSGGSDLRYYTDESGVWTNETVRTGDNYGKDSVIGLNSKDEVVIAYRKDDSSDDIYISVGNRGSWAHSLVAKNRYASYLAMAIDSNDDIHISSHNIRSQSGYCCNKDLEYFTNSSGSWVRTTLETGVGGIFGTMVIDNNDDVHIAHADNIGGNDLLYATVKGSGKGLAVNPVFSVSPGLPNGLILNWKTGEITGAPTVASANTTYTLTAVALGATTTTTFTLHVTGAPGEISYSDISATNGVTISPVTPTITTNATTGSVSTWEINASLPTGLTFETSNGTIWGTPTQITAGAVFTIWANNSVGSQSTTINITIIDVVISSITYSTENFTLSLNHTITSSTPSTSGGTATSFAIHPSLPTGLEFDNSTGKISGTPEVLQTTAVTYTIWANNSGGSFSDQINVTVNDHSPAPINFYGENITLNYNQTLTPITIVETEPDLIAAGEDHSCAIKADGTVRCWGEGSNYRLGYGNNGDRSTPTATASLGTNRTAVDITAGDTHTCVILDDGTVSCWGSNFYGELGDGTTTTRSTPTQTLSLGRPAIAIEAGFDFTCALMDNGSIMCWGRNHYGQLGRGYTNTSSSSQPTPMYTVPLPTGRHAVSIDIGHYHVCAVLDNGSIACWGPGNSNRLGTGSVANQNTPTVIQFFDASNPAVDVALGRYSGCGLLENGSVTCWGKGWLGTGNQNQVQSTAGNIWPNFGTGRTAVKVELGRWHNCALLDNSNVKCWGADGTQQMGNGGGTTSQTTPKKVNFATGIVPKEIISGHWHTCVVSQTHEMYCWGDGASGKLGDGAGTHNPTPGKVGHFSGTNPVKAHGEVTSWAIHPTLPTGLNLGSNNGTLYGRPTASLAQTNFTVYANNSGGSSTFILNLGVGPGPPGPFEYNPENNTWTNNTEVYLAPQFINQTTGNGSIWQVYGNNNGVNGISGNIMNILVGDTIYFNAYNGTFGHELWAHDTSNQTTWRVADINSGTSGSNPGLNLELLVGDTIYFDANDGSTGVELWAHDTSNHSTWRVADINSGTLNSVPGQYLQLLVGDTIYFDANDGSTGIELWAHDTSNHSTWRVTDINSGTGNSVNRQDISLLVGDTIYFSAFDGSTGYELWAHDTSNYSTWRVADINSGTGHSFPGDLMQLLVGDTIYFDANDGSTGYELWAHDISNHSTWRVADINSGTGNSAPGQYTQLLVGDAIYFSANDGSTGIELWAHDTSNHSTWRVTDINNGAGSSVPGQYMELLVSNTIYFSAYDTSTGNGNRELWAHDTSNHSTWRVADINSGTANSNPGQYMQLLVGDTIYFDANDGSTGVELWAHSISNHSTWRVADINSGSAGSEPGRRMYYLIDNAIYFSADDGSTGTMLRAYSPPSINYNTNTGGAVVSWAINASLPSGVTFGTNNGTIYGTPTELWPQTSYMVWANNSGGSSVAYLNITVVDELPTISYSPENLTLTNNTASSDLPLAPIITGSGAITSWTLNNTLLPTGMSFGGTNGTLYGTATQLWVRTSYKVWANNSGGSVVAYFNLTVNDQIPSGITYTPENVTLTKNIVSSDLPLAPSITGPGAITSWELNNTNLPTGVSFGSTNGTLYGTATQLWSRTSYKVWANNSGGSVVAYFNLTVNDQIPLAINYNPENVTMTNNTASSDLPLVPSIFGPGSIVSWELNNTNLPTGISFGSTNGTLYGTATQLWTRTSYKVWANNTGGFVVAYFNLTVNDQVPSIINYNPENVTLTNNTAPSDLPLVPTITGSGAITSWELNNTNLPTGISFGSDNGTLYGTATQLWTRTTYKVWANNSGGSVVAYFNLTVNDQVPSDITYNPENVTLTKDTTSSDLPLVPIITGSGAITSWELNNTNLPTGISFGSTNGTLYGTATQLWSRTAYMVYANNSGGSVEVFFNLTVNDQVPTGIAYTPENVTLTKDTTSSDLPLVPSITGSGLITSWELNNTNLPNGISFGSSNGTLYGTATQLWTRTAYVVYANNTGGSIVAYFNLTVNDQLPTGIVYSPEDVTLTNNTASSDLPLVPTITGSGSITSWELNNTNLPVGISFGSGNGTLYGTATQLWTRTSYKVWANNTGGSVEVYFNLTVVDQVPSSITYSPENVTMTNSIVSSDLPLIPSITGPGLITSWELNNTNLPAGISFGITNGTLYGTATQLWNTTSYKVWANNSGGSVNAYFNLTVVDQVPTLSYSAVSLVLTKGSKSSNFPLNATLNGSGTITSWAISAPLPAGLTFGFSNGTIWGIATELLTTATSYTIWANNSGGSTTTSLTLTINDVRPGPFEYIPENNTWINNTEINLEPQFVNRTTGNASTWRVADINNGTDHSGAGERILLLVGDVIYFDAFDPTYGYELWAYNTSNTTTWRVTNIHPSGGSEPGELMSLVVHDTIYFSANDGSSGHELWAHNTSNESTWRVADIYNGPDSSYPGSYFEAFIGDTLYFSANDGNSGYELWAHNTSNISTWKIADIRNGSDSSNPGSYLSMVVNNTIYFSANDGSTGHELWAYNTSNETIWQAANINPSTGSSPGLKLQILVDDTIYFDADTGAGTGRELWAHNISNLSTWRVTDIASGSADSWPGTYMEILVGDTLYFSSYEVSSGYEMWAHNTSNLSTWRVKDISSSGSSNPGQYMSILVGETIYFSADDGNSGAELWAHNTFNNSTWRVKDISSSGSSNPGQYMSILLGDTIYFSANDGTTGIELWAHDTSNGSTWRVADIYTGSFGSAPGYWSGTIQVENTIYFSANDGATGHEFWAHQPSRIDYNTNTGGDVITWALNASLPNGVSFGTNNGTFYGTPTQLWPQKSYMVWANNSGGSRIGYLNITVVDNVPSFVYPIENLTLTNNTADANLPLVPTLTGPGVITSWELNNSNLPNGISFGTTNGTLYGIATQLWTTTSYKVWANNSGGSVVAHFNLTVIDQIPSSIIYNPENVTITNNTASSDLPLSPSITGSGLITSWELNNTNLPVGVFFGSDNGTLYGIATQLWPTTSYMVWANNTGGTVVSYFNLTVIDQVPTISYSPNDLVLTKNQTSPDLPLSPLVTGTGDITSWELNNTSLPAGITFDANNGTFYGTANQLWNRTSYMVWGNNSGGATVAYLNITVVDQVPAISYSPANLILTNNTNSTHFPLAPTLTGPGDIVTWEMVGILPNGINFGNDNGTFWGKPTQLLNQTQYTVWANNTGGSAVTYLNITVVDQLPLISYNPENLTLLNNTQSPTLPLGPTLAGPGIILEWGISDGLPTGLNFGNDNGTLWGIPTERMNKTMFTIWANNSGGSVTANINITVLHQVPVFSYSVLDLMLVNNTIMNNVTPTITGGEIVSWEASPDMPVGINIDEKGNISGLPTVVQNRTMYMIWANNTGGSHIVYLNITIYDVTAGLDYIPENLILTRNVSMTDLSPVYTGIVDNWDIYPQLPTGLSFANGTISGTPENNMTKVMYTIYANNTGGSISHTINITVLEPIMDFEYIPANVTLVNNTASTNMPMVPILYNDGVAETWEISPTLPSGLNFSSTNGTISGTPTKLQINPVNYTIWANNSGGVGYAIISITIVDQVPNLSYPHDLELINNTNSSELPMLPILDGAGEIVTWEISPQLPTGLNFSSDDGSISGIATKLSIRKQYTVWANNSGGSSMARFNITVVDQVPTDIGYNYEILVLTRNDSNEGILPLSPNLVGPGEITSWEINGTLINGLYFGTDNGTIWGVPEDLHFEWQNYTIYGNNSGGSVISKVAIMVNDQLPTIAYEAEQYVLRNDTEMIPISATHGGGQYVTLAIHPELPYGMIFNFNNGTISGHPTETTGIVNYTIWANNSGGSTQTNILITVEEKPPEISYLYNDMVIYVGHEIDVLPLFVNSSGGNVETYSITPSLPDGLFFGVSNGTIWGVATVDMENTQYTITAQNYVATDTVTINLTSYNYSYGYELDPIWVTKGNFMEIITPLYIIPGATYDVIPNLPKGMSINPNSGVISGRPNIALNLKNYTLTATVDEYILVVEMKLGVLQDTDLDGMPDELPDGDNLQNLIEDFDDDNDNVDDQIELDCGSDPYDPNDTPVFNSNGNCAPEPEGLGFMICIPILLFLIMILVVILATRRRDDVSISTEKRTKSSQKKIGKENWMTDYRIDEDGTEWGEDEEGTWWKRKKETKKWKEWDNELPHSKKK